MVFTLQNLKDHLGITGTDEDDLLTSITNGVNSYIERVTKRAWGETKTATDELQDYDAIIFLDKVAISAVTTVKLGYGDDFDVLDADSYRWNKYGRLLLSHDIYRSRSTEDFDELKITYDYGTATVPEDLYLAALQLATSLYASGTSGQVVSEEQIGSHRIKFADTNNDANDVIKSYAV